MKIFISSVRRGTFPTEVHMRREVEAWAFTNIARAAEAPSRLRTTGADGNSLKMSPIAVAIVALAMLAACSGAAAPSSPAAAAVTTAPSPTPDQMVAARAEYLRIAASANAIVDTSNAAGGPAGLTGFAELLETYMGAVKTGLLGKADWPSEVKPYVDDVVKAATEVEVGASVMSSGLTESGLASLTEATGRLKASVALLRAALGLQPIDPADEDTPFF